MTDSAVLRKLKWYLLCGSGRTFLQHVAPLRACGKTHFPLVFFLKTEKCSFSVTRRDLAFHWFCHVICFLGLLGFGLFCCFSSKLSAIRTVLSSAMEASIHSKAFVWGVPVLCFWGPVLKVWGKNPQMSSCPPVLWVLSQWRYRGRWKKWRPGWRSGSCGFS